MWEFTTQNGRDPATFEPCFPEDLLLSQSRILDLDLDLDLDLVPDLDVSHPDDLV